MNVTEIRANYYRQIFLRNHLFAVMYIQISDVTSTVKLDFKNRQNKRNLALFPPSRFSVHTAAAFVRGPTLIQNGKYPAIIIFDDRMLRYVIAAYQWTS